VTGPTGPTGAAGSTGPIGPTGLLSATGTFYSDYLYWNNVSNTWLAASTEVHIGANAGLTNQGLNAIAIGLGAAQFTQGQSAIAIGADSAYNDQQPNAIAIGNGAGYETQGFSAIAIGYLSGRFTQGQNAIAIGEGCGNIAQGTYGIAIGYRTAEDIQKENAIAIGASAGRNTQGTSSIAIGFSAGSLAQGNDSIAIGTQAGENNQESNSIAIGFQAGQNSQRANTIVLNASGTALNTGTTNACYINPIRLNTAGGGSIYTMEYDTSTNEVTYNNSKTFVIDHPTKANMYLVHACLEGPEAGVYYRGDATILEGTEYVEVLLPEYVSHFACDFTIQVTPVYDGTKKSVYSMTEVADSKFRIYGDSGRVHWVVYGKRLSIVTECQKDLVDVQGSGPYKWIA
jgi:hypothetical protein